MHIIGRSVAIRGLLLVTGKSMGLRGGEPRGLGAIVDVAIVLGIVD
jgi:hypothetical protein